jgi:hypothetical protein
MGLDLENAVARTWVSFSILQPCQQFIFLMAIIAVVLLLPHVTKHFEFLSVVKVSFLYVIQLLLNEFLKLLRSLCSHCTWNMYMHTCECTRICFCACTCYLAHDLRAGLLKLVNRLS